MQRGKNEHKIQNAHTKRENKKIAKINNTLIYHYQEATTDKSDQLLDIVFKSFHFVISDSTLARRVINE